MLDSITRTFVLATLTVVATGCRLGIAFDGDGDRIVMADGDGRLLDGSALLAILGVDLLERDALPGKAIATNIMANGGLAKAIESHGGSVVYTKVGDRFLV